ncbi:MAG TPA: thioredoxin family protein [Candidatus Polarisedimenticolia bacterium]|nr:thioredoxin family protein [Candidatus Polarisedimenticolia bacterium]
MSRSRVHRFALGPLAAALGLACLVGAAARPAGATARSLICRPNYDWAVEVDGAYPKGACFYQTDAQKKFFVDVPSMSDGLLLDLAALKVFTVPRNEIHRNDGRLTVPADMPPGSTAYAFAIEGPIIQFTAGDRKIRILRDLMRPPLTGPVSLDALVEDRPEYREGMKNYTPEADSIKILKSYTKPVELEVYFATWCPHCKVFMPKFLRAVQEANNPKLKLNLVGVPKNFGTEPGPWKGDNIMNIPTVIVKIDGKEITRLGAHEGTSPEAELAGILQAVR